MLFRSPPIHHVGLVEQIPIHFLTKNYQTDGIDWTLGSFNHSPLERAHNMKQRNE